MLNQILDIEENNIDIIKSKISDTISYIKKLI